ncbi:MAG TPA: sialidase family protein [Solirubrobacteraceae bacterium]
MHAAPVLGTLLLGAALAGCGGAAGDHGRRSVRPAVHPAVPYLARAVVTTILPAVVRRTATPRTGGSTDVRGVMATALFSGGGLVTEITDHGVLSSTDGGGHWRRSRLADPVDPPSAVRSGITATIRYVGGSCRLRLVTDGGPAQIRRMPACPRPAVTFADATHALAVDEAANGCDSERPTPPRTYVSDDAARTWRPGGPLPRGLGYADGVAAAGRLYVVAGSCDEAPGNRTGDGPTIAVSRDAGRHWSAMRLPGQAPGCDLSVADGQIWVLCKRVLYRSADAGRTWHAHVFGAQPHPGSARAWRIAATGPNSALAAPQQGGFVLRTRDGGAHWTQSWPRVGPCLGPSASLACFGLAPRLAPGGTGSEKTAWRLDRRTFLVTWVDFKKSGYLVWQRRGGRWRRLFEQPSFGPDGGAAVQLADVNRDGRLDALIEGEAGNGGCGVRDVLAIGRTRVGLLFHRANGCEVYSELRDGLLRFRETIGPCPAGTQTTHCYGGVRTIVRGWSPRVVVDRSFVRCVHPGLDPRRGCRRP